MADVEGAIIPLTAGGGPLRGALFLPDGPGPHPGVVVLHEIFGLNDDIRRIARRFADEGYAALAPDLYSHGSRALCLSRVLLSGGIDRFETETMADISAARAALADRPEVDGNKIGVIGFCLGGGFALLFATMGEVKAASVNYGVAPKSRTRLMGVCPVVASYGRLDKQFVASGERLESHLEALGVPRDIKFYDDAGHAFMSYDNVPGWMQRVPTPLKVSYNEEAAEDTWRRVLAFFATHVRGVHPPA